MAESNRSLAGRLCPTCGIGYLESVRLDDEFTFLSENGLIRVTAHDVPFEACPACGERLSGPEAGMISHYAICKALGLLTPDEIRGVREKLDMTQAEFSRLTGFGEATISRWERGRLLQHRANDRYLRLIASTPENIHFLEGIVDRTPEPSTA